MDKNVFIEKFTGRLPKDISSATPQQLHNALGETVMELYSQQWSNARGEHLSKRRAAYLSMEFLVGRAVYNNLLCLGIYNEVNEAFSELGLNLADLEVIEDAALGNGGLGRLAACFLDSAATLGLPLDGYGIRYKYGLFRQTIEDGFQREYIDDWTRYGDPWSVRCDEDTVLIKFNGQIVKAVPYDMPIFGCKTENIGTLRLWQAEPVKEFDFETFNNQQYLEASKEKVFAEDISRVLYPNDDTNEGKKLRLKQQYFFSAASVADILGNHLNQYGTLENLPDKIAIQLNDTHPTIAIPEMMRILLDECSYEWDAAFDICRKVFAYTNHTVMSEALEKWNVDIFRSTLPRIWQIVQEMDRRCRADLEKAFPGDQGKINYMAIIGDNQVRMANICAYTCHSINGVSKLHSEIIKDSVFHDYFLYKPKAFKNVTNGIAYRRWLLAANPGLTKLLEDSIGPGFKQDASELKKFEKFADDSAMLDKLAAVKRANKVNFANYLEKATGQVIDPDSIFDCQVKRMHEYKRQHLNAMNIAAEYLYLKANPNADFVPKTYIFGAKAAPGYYMAKQMIRMICKLGDLINNDPAVRDKLRVVYLEEYCVSLSEHLMPAAEVSEQISLAGTEASGTGNMKFMLNGAITLGTLDGANVEIADAAGKENELIFGMLTPEVNNLKQVGYHPSAFIMGDDVANAALNFLERGWNGENFHEVTENLRSSDPYMVMADFKDYRRAQADLQKLYADREKWAQMSLKNTANSGIFSADRAVLDYARDIWYASPVPMGK